MNGRTALNPAGPMAVLLALGMAFLAPQAAAHEPPETFRWSLEVEGVGTLIVDLAQGWKPGPAQFTDGLAEWRATTRSQCVMTVRIVASPAPDPGFNGPTALHEFVRRQAEALLPEAIEARYTLTELRGPESGGYYFALRERAPRRKQAAYITQGAIGLGNLRAEFSFSSPAPDLPEIQRALKALAATRLDRHEAQEETP